MSYRRRSLAGGSTQVVTGDYPCNPGIGPARCLARCMRPPPLHSTPHTRERAAASPPAPLRACACAHTAYGARVGARPIGRTAYVKANRPWFCRPRCIGLSTWTSLQRRVQCRAAARGPAAWRSIVDLVRSAHRHVARCASRIARSTLYATRCVVACSTPYASTLPGAWCMLHATRCADSSLRDASRGSCNVVFCAATWCAVLRSVARRCAPKLSVQQPQPSYPPAHVACHIRDPIINIIQYSMQNPKQYECYTPPSPAASALAAPQPRPYSSGRSRSPHRHRRRHHRRAAVSPSSTCHAVRPWRASPSSGSKRQRCVHARRVCI
jgi:hypothetical protein